MCVCVSILILCILNIIVEKTNNVTLNNIMCIRQAFVNNFHKTYTYMPNGISILHLHTSVNCNKTNFKLYVYNCIVCTRRCIFVS